ncbi:hypothetical protein ATJ88_0238 [Isoptericola jiangsuensis]|uniref:Lipoprotein LprG n=1 Tax=Isoptericola jiangsuensis TaxID=548579 RepID=A0A2A9ESQ1_9MICO|nr:hypothetical protein [Isoptericola jiangsuensis]PFG41596.1 hypothetical protein ATJ88_0238 [Isoptericola jiangsuensis]
MTGHDAAPTPAGTPSEEAPDGPAAALPECDGFLLSEGEEIDGRTVGECVAAAMVLAGSGVQRVDSDDGTSSTVSFRWDPDYAMSVDGDQQVVVEGDTGWVRMPGTGWVQADPDSSDPQVVMATGVVDLVRVFSDPRVLAEGFAAAPTWTVVEEAPVPADDAVADVAWRLEPEGGVLPLGDVSVTDYELWLRPDHLGVLARGTSSYAGVSVTTSNTFLSWGGDVDIPDPSAS